MLSPRLRIETSSSLHPTWGTVQCKTRLKRKTHRIQYTMLQAESVAVHVHVHMDLDFAQSAHEDDANIVV